MHKSDDIWGVDCCFTCYDVIDGRVLFEFLPGEKEQYFFVGVA